MIFKNKRNIILLILIFITVLIISSCSIKKENPNVINLSGKLDFDFKIYYEGIDEFSNYTNLHFEYDGIKTEVFQSMKLNIDINGLPVVIKEDIDLDGKYELVIYLLEKQRQYYKEKIYFLNYDNGSGLSLEQINQKLRKDEELEIKPLLVKDAFENENIGLSFIKRKKDSIEVNSDGNKAFKLVEDISKEDNNITVEIYEDDIIKKINYINNENLPSAVFDAKKDFIDNNTELIRITKNEKGLLINTQGSYLIDYKDVNNDNTEDIIFICDTRENKILNDNVYYLNGIDLERKYIYVNELSILPNDYPLHLINLYSVVEPGERMILALRNDETFYLTDKIAGASIVVRVKDFNDDGENEIAIINDPRYTFGRERFVYIYKEKYFEKIPFSTDSIFDIVESLFEYSIEYIEDGQACLATIKDKKNNDQIVIKISSDVAKPNFEFVYHESIVSNIVNNGINEIISLCVINTENWRFVTILDIEVIYEMQNNEFVVKDIKNTLISDLSVVYGFDEYKFEIIENSIIDTNP
ncbi:MAG: hypothetical protein PHY13_03765 [Clostridia bacterium]|jgi:hypothetical protein|nr:hypothetical protein [Clostridia bacterium]MDD3092904.1 hypothetical protein [Clostridia bacterium]MDD4542870.1 hypothetical protein [Clostridia bacterium]